MKRIELANNGALFYTIYTLPMFRVSFGRQNVQVSPSEWLFSKRNAGRFEWIALLAYRKLESSSGQSLVGLEDIARLPSWRAKTRHHIGTNIGRYIQAFDRKGMDLVEAAAIWVGPYQLRVPASSIKFDISLDEVQKRLCIRSPRRRVGTTELREFTLAYARAYWLYFQGQLAATQEGRSTLDSAYGRFRRMAENQNLNPRLRLLAFLAAIRVLFRLGRFGYAREQLMNIASLSRTSGDHVLQAQYHLALAWSFQRGSSGTDSNRATERALSTASRYAEEGGDRAALGLLAYRRSGLLTKLGRHEESIELLLYAIEAALVTGNFDEVQAYCCDTGSVVHRLGPAFYDEARRWILSGIAIARWMRLGRDDAHGEMILGKMYSELGRPALAYNWLRRAEQVAKSSGNQLNLADVKMVWAFWLQRFGTRSDQVETLVEALRLFRTLRNFDCRQKERYMARKFPSIWPGVLTNADSTRSG